MRNKTILFKSDKIGEGELGFIVMNGFMKAISLQETLPKKIVFLNRGVLLTTQNEEMQNSEIITFLKKLESAGVKIISCETCLDYFGVKNNVLVGRIGNAFEVMEDFLNNDGVISL